MQNDLSYRLYKEELELSPISKRAIAFLIDKLILAFIVFAAMGDRFDGKDVEGIIIAMNEALLFTTVVEVSYQTLFTKLYGGSIGKILLKIKVVGYDSFGDIGWYASFLRATVRFLSETLFYAGFMWALFVPSRQGWHDLASKTLVIDVKA